MTKHTPEPWAVDPSDQREICPAADMQFGIASACNVDPSETPGKWFFGPQSQANARRIVACVNICEGISTEDLEQHSDVVSAQLATEYTLQQQNEDLLTALEEVSASLAWVALGQCRAMEDQPIMPPEMAIELARAAIAKATA